MKKLSALALAAAFGLAGLAPLAADAATVKKVVHHHPAKTALVCHKVKEKDGKLHLLCHHAKKHAMAKHVAKKHVMKKKVVKK